MNTKKLLLLIAVFTFIISLCHAQRSIDAGLKVIEQDYEQALAEASKDNKLLLIDFYTTWCGPCKKIDKLVFQNDSVRNILSNDVVLLKYNAENDTVFHLSKKHHVSSYPTGLVLNQDGYVVNRKYGFLGDDFQSLSNNIIEFVNESITLNENDELLTGYSTQITPSVYPSFYTNFVNRTNTDIDSSEVNDYFTSADDVFSEQYFSTLIYFASEANDDVANKTLENQDRYLALYGNTDVEILTYFLTVGKFNRAIEQKDSLKYEEAVAFAKKGLSTKWTDSTLPSFKKQYLQAQNRWDKVLEINARLKDNNELSNGYINHFSWQVYKTCDDQEVIRKCVGWMKEVTNEEPTFDYLDTYAFLTYKSGNEADAKRIAKLAIKAGKVEDRNTKGLEKLLAKF